MLSFTLLMAKLRTKQPSKHFCNGGALTSTSAEHSANLRDIHQKNWDEHTHIHTHTISVLKPLCRARVVPMLKVNLQFEAPDPSISHSSARQAGQLLPDRGAHKEHTVWIRIKRTNRIWITHLLLLHEGILSLRDMGSFLEHLAKKSVLPSNY